MSNSVKTIYLKDYQAPDYLIDETHLKFELFENFTMVHAELHIRRNPDKQSDELPELVLDGQELELLTVVMDNVVINSNSYTVDDKSLTLQPNKNSFILKTTVRIHPETNTALEGLYKSNTMFCTQCEAEGFRKITYYLDRPDVMSKFTTTIEADQQSYPILLSNGNQIASGQEDDRHWATWQDPFKKPAYLFALVAGDLWCVEDSFTTMNQRKVDLRIYVEPENINKVNHAMTSLKNSMRWDEEVYGREYDLDIFMIVAVSDFNMGAMENKGLNIFNTSCVLARPETATDMAHQRVEGVVAHEYFHNWSGNRVTCRDWFQLSLKEGFTVFRDSEFTADMNSRTVKRIEDVAFLRTHQFAEDAGPMAHPIRPDAYMEISNFYTVTIYEKGAEIIRMLHTLLGKEGFRKGTDLYFERHDGQAVTCDDFVKALADANAIDLTQFKRWYSQAGTPQLEVLESYDSATKQYHLTFKQFCPPTPNQEEKQPFVIPVKMGLLNKQGQDLPLQLVGEGTLVGDVILITEAEQTFTFANVGEKPVPSLLRDFSAPVKLKFAYSKDDLLFLMQHDNDGFNRWDASQRLAIEAIQQQVVNYQAGNPMVLDSGLEKAYASLLADSSLDQAMVAEMLSLPAENYLVEISEVADPDAIHAARQFIRQQLANNLKGQFLTHYQANRAVSQQEAYRATADHIARRSLQNMALSYLMLTDDPQVLTLCLDQFKHSDNMTEQLAALTNLVNSPYESEKQQALVDFYEQFANDPLVIDQWFAVQANSQAGDSLARVVELMKHEAFTIKNPNKVRSLIGAFANNNLTGFHQKTGAGYQFLADQVLALNTMNPQIASRLLTPLTRWRKYDEERQQLMKAELERIMAADKLSSDVYEVVNKSLV
ncbi:aminopeptidase N [Entomomonas moraniae]|uniref:Aminopeptidase N n=1 Tax=Entomomonas moraniae TaxID=2213226 RepID=A0A3Q9JJE8_9GAMM|nr:aminopeptidase N [Entomomonas moraniae]AZS50884.1 aminopeptidase N [Entomomonas moraniae]